MKPLSLIYILFLALFLSSCTGIIQGITGQKPEVVTVHRLTDDGEIDPSGEPFLVAKRDVIDAEIADDDEVHGLYDLNYVADQTAKVIDLSGK